MKKRVIAIILALAMMLNGSIVMAAETQNGAEEELLTVETEAENFDQLDQESKEVTVSEGEKDSIKGTPKDIDMEVEETESEIEDEMKDKSDSVKVGSEKEIEPNNGDFSIEDGVLLAYNGTEKEVVIPAGVTSIGDSAFAWNGEIESIVIPEGVTAIGQDAFWNCTSLKDITIPDSVVFIGKGAFDGASWLYNKQETNPLVVVNHILVDGSTASGNVIIPSDVTVIGSHAFANNVEITGISIPDSVKKIEESAFSGCESVKTLEIPNSVESMEKGVFSDCAGLEAVTLPEGLNSISAIMFYGCSSLTIVQIPDSVRRIEVQAFSNCGNLKTVEFPENLHYIEYGAFSGCSGLEIMELPQNLYEIGNAAFSDCSNLNKVVIPSNVYRIETIMGETPDVYKAFKNSPNVTIYGENNSYAQFYAESNDIPFQSTGENASGITLLIENVKGSLSDVQMKLTWDEVTGADGYIISAAWDWVDSFREIGRIEDGSITSYTYDGSELEKIYAYVIYAYRIIDGETISGSYYYYDDFLNSSEVSFTVALTGDAVYGETLTAKTNGEPEGAELTYSFYREGESEAIQTGTMGSYVLTAADVGKRISVKVTAKAESEIAVSEETDPVAKREISIIAEDKNKEYGTEDPKLTYKIVSGSLVEQDKLKGELVREDGEDKGVYAITQGTLTNVNNPGYEISFQEGIMSINPIYLTWDTSDLRVEEKGKVASGQKAVLSGSLKVSGILKKDQEKAIFSCPVEKLTGIYGAVSSGKQRITLAWADEPVGMTGEMAENYVLPETLPELSISISEPPVEESTIFYAVLFETNGGSGISAIVQPSDTIVNLSKYQTTREGYTFTGWYADKELTKEVTEIQLDTTKTVYAGWEKIDSDTRQEQKIHMTVAAQERDLKNGSRTTKSKVCTLKLGFDVDDPDLKLTYQTSDPAVATVKDGKITYQGVGTCTITVTAEATDTCKETSLGITVKVGKPGAPTFTPSVTKKTAKKAFTATSSTVKGVDGWEVQYSIREDFWKPVTKDFPNTGTKLYRKTCTTMQSNRTYYIHVRGYQIVDGKKVYSDWSPVKTVRTK